MSKITEYQNLLQKIFNKLEIADLDKLTRRFASEGKNTNRGAIYRKL